MTLIFIAILIALLTLEALFSAYFGRDRGRPKWMRWFDGGILLLLIVFLVAMIGQTLSLLNLKM
jgi:threonine/homoserine/homoserine lactone efflux protein